MTVNTREFVSLQAAFIEALERREPLYLPAGSYDGSQLNSGAATWVAIYGDGPDTFIRNGLHLGPGAAGSGAKPSGWLRDLTVEGGLTLDGLRLFRIENIEIKDADIGLDLVNNCFGAVVDNCLIGYGGNCDVGVNIRHGDQSGNDLSFNSCWIGSKYAAVHASPGCTNIHFRGGQLAAGIGLSATDDAHGVVTYGKDYSTGATGGVGGLDFSGVDFEGFSRVWAFRGFGQVAALVVNSCTFFAHNPQGPALGFAHMTNVQQTKMGLDFNRLGGSFVGPNMIVLDGAPGSIGSTFLISERGTMGTEPLTIAGVESIGTFRSLALQSGLGAGAIVEYAQDGAKLAAFFV